MKRLLKLVALVAGAASLGDAAFGDGKTAPTATEQAGIRFFESHVRPVLVKHCYECHSEQSGKAEGELRVDSREAIRKGGSRGPAVVPGHPRQSWLLTAVSHSDADLHMPPRQDKLPQTIISDLKKWVAMGAPDPRETVLQEPPKAWGDMASRRRYWSYQPVHDCTPPTVRDADWPRDDLDRFILATLQHHGLAPSPDAKPIVLLRRLHFDLVGLPPSPAALQDFLRDVENRGIDAALAAVVDRLLSTPQFGERWGRHWLDVARYGESSGKEANIAFPYAWRYRDYVIDCVNADVPYDRFLTEQIAGDLLPADTSAERARLLIATGFLAVGTKNLDEGNAAQFAANLIDEQIDAVTRAVLGNSIACARCHDHKFDPFTMMDYYALAGIFASTKTWFGTAVSPANRVGGDPLVLPAVEGQLIPQASIPPEKVAELKHQLADLKQEETDKRAAVAKAIAKGEDASNIFTLRDALRIFWQSGGIEGQLEKVDEQGHALPLAMGVSEQDAKVDAPLLDRGEVAKPGQPVPRGFPDAISVDHPPAIPADQSGRLQLAQWLVRPDHPLTSRVMVNRIWRHLLGTGLVATVDNFGTSGQPPSHPELLEHLATRFTQHGWSVKRMVRTIALSRTYRQASEFREDAFQRDPDNRWLWRASKRRLEAEAIRDAMLSVSDELDLVRPAASLVATTVGDGPIALIGLNQRLPSDLDGALYRSVYLPVIRDRLPDVLDLFDFAEPSLVTGDRSQTNVPIQALYLLNSPFVRARAAGLAARLQRDADSTADRITLAFELCYGRQPGPAELARSFEYLSAESAGSPEATMVNLCQVLLCTAEFRNID